MKKISYRRRKRKINAVVFIILTIFIAVSSYLLVNLDSKIMPPVLAVMDKEAKTRINYAIDKSISNITKKNNLSSDDFYKKTSDESGMVNSLSVDTVLVNNVCSSLAVEISNELEAYGAETVKMPISAIFNVGVLSNLGPRFPISVLPSGNAVIDYDTKFESVGINQINFQLWLQIDSYVQIVNPIQQREIIVSRKIALVNTVFSGKVPESYYQGVPVLPSASKAD